MLNRIIESLSPIEVSSIFAQLERVPLVRNAVLATEGEAMTHVYFPVSGLIALITKVGDQKIESVTVGAEGVLGLPCYLSAGVSDSDCVVQVAGEAWRLPSEAFVQLTADNPGLEAAVKRYTAMRMRATYRSAACSLVHDLAHRAVRWLLLVHDHTEGDELHLTHKYLAGMMGVRRAGITHTLGALQREGIITSRRGRIMVLDRQRLEAEACECDAIIRGIFI